SSRSSRRSMANGSLNTVFAKSKLTPCVQKLASALALCHSNSSSITLLDIISFVNYQREQGERTLFARYAKRMEKLTSTGHDRIRHARGLYRKSHIVGSNDVRSLQDQRVFRGQRPVKALGRLHISVLIFIFILAGARQGSPDK